MKGNFLSFLIALIIAAAFSCLATGCSAEDDTFAPTEIKLLAQGTAAKQFQLGFKPAKDMTGVTAYMMVYSKKDIAAVRAGFIGKDRAYFDNFDKEAVNKGKLIKNLSYADGAANTLYGGQLDVADGGSLTEPGLYHFYVLSLSDAGFLGIGEADKTFKSKPAPENFLGVRDGGYALNNYGASMNKHTDLRVEGTFIFYSKLGLTNMTKKIQNLTFSDIEGLVKAKKGISIPSNEITARFTADTRDIDGAERDNNAAYYIYGLAYSNEGGALGLAKANLMLVPQNGPAPLESIGGGPGKGRVVAAGGATSLNPASKTYVEEYIKSFKETTGVARPRVAVFESSSGSESTMYDYFYNDGDASDVEVLSKDGCEAVYIPLGIDNYKVIANEKYFADLVKSCHVALFMGGDQAKHARCQLNDDGTLTEIGKAVRYIFEKGGTISGTSAGAAVLSNPAFQSGGDYSYQPLYWNGTEMVKIGSYNGKTDPDLDAKKRENNIAYEGTGFLELAAGKKILVDTHFDVRGRLGRLAAALRDTDPTGLAIGLDEGTMVCVDAANGRLRAAGNGGVFILDARDAVWGKGERFSARGIKITYLTAGDSYDPADGKLYTGKKQALPSGNAVAVAKDAFGSPENKNGYVSTTLLLQFLDSAQKFVSVPVYRPDYDPFSKGPQFFLTFKKTGGAALSSFSKTAATGVVMDITDAKENGEESGGSSGCSAGFPFAAFLAAGAAFTMRKKFTRRNK